MIFLNAFFEPNAKKKKKKKKSPDFASLLFEHNHDSNILGEEVKTEICYHVLSKDIRYH